MGSAGVFTSTRATARLAQVAAKARFSLPRSARYVVGHPGWTGPSACLGYPFEIEGK
jgi:hypothetical protein